MTRITLFLGLVAWATARSEEGYEKVYQRMTIKLSIVVPAFNEGSRLGDSLTKIFNYLNTYEPAAEVIVVDDGSTDDTASVAEDCFSRAGQVKTKLITVTPNRGKGHAVRTGLAAATGQIAVFSDADLSTPISELPTVVKPIEDGAYDLVIGSRALNRKLIGVHQPWRREMAGRVFNTLVKLATNLPFKDTQCGFKAFRLGACRPIINAATVNRFAFDVELLYIANLANLRISEVAVRWNHDERSKVKMFRDSWRMLMEVQATRAKRRHFLRELHLLPQQHTTSKTDGVVA